MLLKQKISFKTSPGTTDIYFSKMLSPAFQRYYKRNVPFKKNVLNEVIYAGLH